MLFLDEISLYRSEILESLRAPLEEGVIRIARSGGAITFPCRFALIAAMNPCACGFHGDGRIECRCTARALERYSRKLSGPLLDRFDMQIGMSRLTKDELLVVPAGESSVSVRARVENARAMQRARYGTSVLTNGSVPHDVLRPFVSLDAEARSLLEHTIDSSFLTGRGLNRVLRVARTIADLNQSENLLEEHIGEAILLRMEHAEVGSAA